MREMDSCLLTEKLWTMVFSNGCEGLLWWGVLLFVDDVILHHPCHIFWVAVGSSAACCLPVCCRCWDHMDPALSCLSGPYLSPPGCFLSSPRSKLHGGFGCMAWRRSWFWMGSQQRRELWMKSRSWVSVCQVVPESATPKVWLGLGPLGNRDGGAHATKCCVFSVILLFSLICKIGQ